MVDAMPASAADTFDRLLAAGFWPIGLYPAGAAIPRKSAPATGKEPFGPAWGLERWSRVRWDAALRKFPALGVGICLGPGRGPGRRWQIDCEGDGPEAEASLLKLFGGEVVATLGWSSARGFHWLFLVDEARLLAILPGFKGFEVKNSPTKGVYTFPGLPGLELRLGGYKEDGTIKQAHSACPPTVGTDGEPRRWAGADEVAEVPDTFYATLAGLVAPAAAPAPSPFATRAAEDPFAGRVPEGRPSAEARARAYLATCEPAVSGEGGHDKTFGVACRVGPGFDLPPDVALRLMREDYNPRCRPPWSEAELRHKVQQAYEREPKRGWLLQDPPVAPGPGGGGDGPAVDDRLPRFGNYRWVEFEDDEGRSKKKPEPHDIHRIDADRVALTGGWPKRVAERLFVESAAAEPIYLGSAARLFSWLDALSHVDWTKGSRFVTQERLYEHLRMVGAERYDSIELMPHVPPFPGAYYMHAPLPAPSGRLEELLDQFLPHTPADRSLIMALILTPLWGGEPGTRPAFLVTGPDYDEGQGRGLGKTTLLDLVADVLYGGSIDVAANEEMAAVKTRMLSAEGESKRIARLDNVKSLRFSWGDLEGMITARNISGHSLYQGEGQRRNDLVWVITLNGASLSKDMAERVVTIKLARPPKGRDAGWRDRVVDFMARHRWDILADAAAVLAADPGPLRPATRWASWERSVLSKLPLAAECQAALVERQGVIDEGNSDREIVRDALCELMGRQGFEPDESALEITAKTMAEIVSDACRKHYETAAATTFVKGLAIPELVQVRKTTFRGWVWCGERADPSDLQKFTPNTRSDRWKP